MVAKRLAFGHRLMSKTICNAYNAPDRVVAMLEYFDEHGWIKLEATQIRHLKWFLSYFKC